MAVQVSVFVQNEPGRLAGITSAISKAGVNIRATTIASSEGFGVAKFLVDKPDVALDALKTAGFSVKLRSVVAVKMDDSVGGLDRVLPLLGEKKINIEDAYGFILDRGKEAVFVFEVDNPDELGEYLTEKGCKIMKPEDLYGL
ncbi:MAG TPA: ACT domain-containing protein [bacterium]|nr:ACT domain-containing protein [bacterium]